MIRFLLAIVLVLGTLLNGGDARAVEPNEVLSDPALEARARELSKNLRCLVCQNQTIDDSNADLARDLRLIVRERLEAGDSDTQVIAFVTNRYGDFVLLTPPLKTATLSLWFGPFILLALGAFGMGFYFRRRRRQEDGSETLVPLTAAERKKLKKLLDEPEDSQ